MIWIEYAAPFAVFRDFTAGYFRSSFSFTPPSAIYGLLLNIAGIEMRANLGPGPTETLSDLPHFRVASAAPREKTEKYSFKVQTKNQSMPGKAMLFQQLHTIPVGTSSKERAPLTKGNKYHIAPARRQILTSLQGICVVDASAELEKQIETGIEQVTVKLANGEARYGLPFLGDNNFFLEQLSIISPNQQSVDWIVQEQPNCEGGNDIDDLDCFDNDGEDSTSNQGLPFRLTIWADRTGMINTRDAMFKQQPGKLDSPPEQAWVQVGPIG